MEEIINIYTKLIIAIISFIAPLIIYLLSIFNEGLAYLKEESETELQQLDKIVKEHLQTEGIIIHKIINDFDLIYKKHELKLADQKNLLNPKRQIKRIFSVLFIALSFLLVYQLADKQQWLEAYNALLLAFLFSLSITASLTGLFFLKKVAWVIIDVRKKLGKVKNKQQIENLIN